MAGRFTADYAAALFERLEHVAVSNGGTLKFDVSPLQRPFEPQVTHDRSHHGTVEPALLLPRGRQHVQDLVAVHQSASLVHENHAVPIVSVRALPF